MRALLLAAGTGTRLRPLTDTVPKCLAPIGGRPLLGWWIDHLFAAGIERLVINTHHHAGAVREFVSSHPMRSRIDLCHEERLLGTGGTVRATAGHFGDEDFLLAHADNLADFDVPRFQAAHAGRPAECAMTMLTFITETPASCGILELDGAARVVAMHEKTANPPGRLANAAVYILTAEVTRFLRQLPGPGIDFSTGVIPAFLGRILAVPTDGYHRDIGTPESLRRAEADFPLTRLARAPVPAA